MCELIQFQQLEEKTEKKTQKDERSATQKNQSHSMLLLSSSWKHSHSASDMKDRINGVFRLRRHATKDSAQCSQMDMQLKKKHEKEEKEKRTRRRKNNVRLNHRLRNITLIITQTNKHKFLFFLSLSCCLCSMPSPHFSRHCRAIGF